MLTYVLGRRIYVKFLTDFRYTTLDMHTHITYYWSNVYCNFISTTHDPWQTAVHTQHYKTTNTYEYEYIICYSYARYSITLKWS